MIRPAETRVSLVGPLSSSAMLSAKDCIVYSWFQLLHLAPVGTGLESIVCCTRPLNWSIKIKNPSLQTAVRVENRPKFCSSSTMVTSLNDGMGRPFLKEVAFYFVQLQLLCPRWNWSWVYSEDQYWWVKTIDKFKVWISNLGCYHSSHYLFQWEIIILFYRYNKVISIEDFAVACLLLLRWAKWSLAIMSCCFWLTVSVTYGHNYFPTGLTEA